MIPSMPLGLAAIASVLLLSACSATTPIQKKDENPAMGGTNTAPNQTVTVHLEGKPMASPDAPVQLPLKPQQAPAMQQPAYMPPYGQGGYAAPGYVPGYAPAPTYGNPYAAAPVSASQVPVTKMDSQAEAPNKYFLVKEKSSKQPELIKITAIGYGSESTFEGFTVGQRRLMAIRASKLDAYRSLAEQIMGIKIDSNTSLATLTAKNDSFRARVNAMVRGARVISVTPLADENYETVVEVYVSREFFNQVFVYNAANDSNATGLGPIELTCGSQLNCVELDAIQ